MIYGFGVRRTAATGSGIGDSPESHRRTVLSSRSSTSTAKRRADSPDAPIAFRSSSREVPASRGTLSDTLQLVAGNDPQLVLLERPSNQRRVLVPAPHRLAGPELPGSRIIAAKRGQVGSVDLAALLGRRDQLVSQSRQRRYI